MATWSFHSFVMALCLTLTSLSGGEAPLRYYRQEKAAGPVVVHVLEVPPAQWDIIPVVSLEDGLGRETVPSMAQRYGAYAAINSNFFAIDGLYDGAARSALKIDDNWYQWPKGGRAALGWRKGDNRVRIGRPAMLWKVCLGGVTFTIDAINAPAEDDQVVLCTAAFHRSSLSGPETLEVLVSDGQVAGKRRGGNGGALPADGYAVVFGNKRKSESKEIVVGAEATLTPTFLNDHDEKGGIAWSSCDYIVGGTPWLVSDGVPTADMDAEGVLASFINARHPRTAVGVRGDGTWIVAVVDGRRLGYSMGMTLAELAQTMVTLGCVEAINLDGGQSSTLFVDGHVANSPATALLHFSKGEARPVGGAIVFKERKL